MVKILIIPLINYWTIVTVIFQRDTEGCTALLIAASRGHLEVVEELLRQPSCCANVQNCEGRTAMMEAARNYHLDILRHLLPYSDVNVVDSHGYTAIMEAVSTDDEAVAKLLLDAGASANISDSRLTL